MTQPPLDDALRTLTVGPADADLVGTNHRAIQFAVDALALRGGGTVRLLPGTYELIDAIHLRPHVAIIGDRDNVLLKRGPSLVRPLAEDADIGQRQVRPDDPRAFRPGMGVMFRDGNGKTHGTQTMPLYITAIRDDVLYLNDYINHDWIAESGAQLIAYTPLIHGFEANHVHLEGLTLDGRPDNPPTELAGVWGGNIYLRRCRHVVMRNIESYGCYGDGIRFGQCDDVLCEHCHCHDNTEYGFHAGSHTGNVIARHCDIHHNGSDGLYICWGITHSRFEHNHIHHNGHIRHRTGLSIGHKDTDNVIAHNHIHNNHKHGIVFREKTEANGAHRNRITDNIIENNGTPWSEVPEYLHNLPHQSLIGAGVYVNGITHDLAFERNLVRETRTGDERQQRLGFYFGPGVSRVTMTDNQVHGHVDHDLLDESDVLANESTG